MDCYICCDIGLVEYRQKHFEVPYIFYAHCVCEKGKPYQGNLLHVQQVFPNIYEIARKNKEKFQTVKSGKERFKTIIGGVKNGGSDYGGSESEANT